MNLKWINKYAIFIIILLCFLSRLPLLLSEYLYLDGDECIVGLMAKHFYEGIDVPFFFYGQSYGFSFIEVVFIRTFYGFFGINDFSIKLAMLSLWTIGVIFLYKTLKHLRQKENDWLPLLITIVFIFVPSFALWSMKARGGYLTAFTITFIITYLVSNKRLYSYLTIPFIIGVLSVTIFESQALWLVGLLPILIYYFFKQTNIWHSISLFSGGLIGWLIFGRLKIGLSKFWSPGILVKPDFSFGGIISVISNIFKNQTGSYFYYTYIEPSFINQIAAIFITTLILGGLIIGLIFLIVKKEIHKMFYVVTLSVLITIGSLFFIDASNFRYILPLNSFIFLMFYFILDEVARTKIVNIVLGILILLGAISIYDFKDFSPENKSELLSTIDELEEKNIQYVFCEPGLLQWQLMFYSNEQIIARSQSNIDRYPEYVKKVNNAFNNTNAKTAMIGYLNYGHEIYIQEDPDLELLKEHGFIFEN